MRALAPACPPKARSSITSTESPSDAAYTAAASPAGPAPAMTTSYTVSSVPASSMPMQRASSLSVGLRSTSPSGQIASGSCSGSGA